MVLGTLLAGSPGWAQTRSKVLPRDPEPRTGQVAGAPETMADAAALAVRVDAARVWKRDDNGQGLTVRTEAVTWRDGAIGCPAPDRLYSQNVVPGWRISVGDEKRAATYHATGSGKWLLCPADRAQAPLPAEALR
ncbi:MAG: hypothetical protein ABL916_10195 [Burkholderiaceae bacterium]